MSAIADNPAYHPVMAVIDAARVTLDDFIARPMWTLGERDLPAAATMTDEKRLFGGRLRRPRDQRRRLHPPRL